jgi:hypothetical protein
MDRHKPWREIASWYEHCEKEAPEGYVPVVLVYLLDRPAPLLVGNVTTHREEDNAWVTFSVSSALRLADPEGDPDNVGLEDVQRHELVRR